jgi:pimeloyl-ACP methyl ester carboxylesterase
MAYCAARGLRFDYVDVGEGPPVVLLHPAPLDHHVWLYTMLPLSEHFRVLAVDQRCFGRSSKPEHSFAIPDYGESRGVPRRAGDFRRAHPRHLAGGIAAQLLAPRHPSRVQKIVLIATTAHTTTVPFVHERLGRLRAFARNTTLEGSGTGPLPPASVESSRRPKFIPRFCEQKGPTWNSKFAPAGIPTGPRHVRLPGDAVPRAPK